MEYFKVSNLDKFQQYKDRNPTWIKLHRSVLTDFDHVELPDTVKWHLCGIWLIASAHNNKLPYNDEMITRLIQANTKTNLNLLLTKGFIEIIGERTQPVQTPYEPCNTETETEKSREEIDISDELQAKLFEVCGELPQATFLKQEVERWTEGEIIAALDYQAARCEPGTKPYSYIRKILESGGHKNGRRKKGTRKNKPKEPANYGDGGIEDL